MVLPIATGIMLWTMYLPTDTGAPSLMPKGTCGRQFGVLGAQLVYIAALCLLQQLVLTGVKSDKLKSCLRAASQILGSKTVREKGLTKNMSATTCSKAAQARVKF